MKALLIAESAKIKNADINASQNSYLEPKEYNLQDKRESRQKNRAEMRTGSLQRFIFHSACVYQTLEAKFLHPGAVNEPYLIE